MRRWNEIENSQSTQIDTVVLILVLSEKKKWWGVLRQQPHLLALGVFHHWLFRSNSRHAHACMGTCRVTYPPFSGDLSKAWPSVQCHAFMGLKWSSQWAVIRSGLCQLFCFWNFCVEFHAAINQKSHKKLSGPHRFYSKSIATQPFQLAQGRFGLSSFSWVQLCLQNFHGTKTHAFDR